MSNTWAVVRVLDMTFGVAVRLLVLCVVYLVIRFALSGQLESVGPYASYIFEAVCVGFTAIALRGLSRGQLRVPWQVVWHLPLAVVVGFGVYWGAGFGGVTVPFDFSAGELLIFLLFIGPVLEEGIFRFMLWQPVQRVTSRHLAFVLTTLLFAYSHFHSYWSLPAEYHSFLFYQTGYTLLLGAWCGFFIWRYQSLTSAVLVHMLFNFGFYLGFTVS